MHILELASAQDGRHCLVGVRQHTGSLARVCRLCIDHVHKAYQLRAQGAKRAPLSAAIMSGAPIMSGAERSTTVQAVGAWQYSINNTPVLHTRKRTPARHKRAHMKECKHGWRATGLADTAVACHRPCDLFQTLTRRESSQGHKRGGLKTHVGVQGWLAGCQ